MAILLPSVDPLLPDPPPDNADGRRVAEYARSLNARLRELFVALNTAVEPINRYKTSGQLLTADSTELNGVAWSAAPSSGDTYRGKHVMWWLPSPSSATPTVVGFRPAVIFAGGATAPTSTSYLTSFYRYPVSTTAVAGTQGTADAQTPAFWRGNAAGLGGFRVEMMMGVAATQTTMRIFCGLNLNAVNMLATDPSTFTDCVFLGCDSADTNMQVMHNDNAGTCTKIDLGASFPKTNNVVYRAVFECAANASTITYTVTRLDSAATATGTLSTNLPTNTAFMTCGWYVANGATAAIATINAYKITAEIPE